MPTALGGGLPAETPAHCQSCQTVSLPDFYKNPRPCCPLPNTLLRQYLWGPWACAKRRRLFSTIYGQEPGSPSPITRLGSQGSCYSLGLTPRISASKPASGRGPGGGGQVGSSGQPSPAGVQPAGPPGVPSACSQSGRARAGSYQIRPGQRGLDRLKRWQLGGAASLLVHLLLLRCPAHGASGPCQPPPRL